MAIIVKHTTEEKIYLKFHVDTLDEVKIITLETVGNDLLAKSFGRDDLYFVEVGPLVDDSYAIHFEGQVIEALGKLVAS